MKDLKELLELLQSDTVTDAMCEYYDDYEDCINPKWRNREKFISFMKGFYIDRYLDAPSDRKKIIIDNLKKNNLSTVMTRMYVDSLNGSVATERENLDGVYLDEFEDLLQLIDDPMHDEVSEYNELIMDSIKDCRNFVTMEDIKSKDTTATYGYRFTDEEIKALECAKLVPGLNNLIHSLYDEYTLSGVRCNYNLIEDEVLKRFAFHTDKTNPEFKVLFEDGTILYYEDGDIKFCPIDFFALTEYVKLQVIYYFTCSSEDDEELQVRCNNYGLDIEEIVGSSFSFLEEETKSLVVLMAVDDVCDEVDCLLNNYSKKMIEDSKQEVVKYDEYVKKYKL